MSRFTVNINLDDNAFFSAKANCIEGYDKNWYYMVSQGDESAIREKNKMLSILEYEQLNEGAYVWVIISHGDMTEMYLMRTRTLNEVGSSHSHLVRKIQEQFPGQTCVLHYSGEFLQGSPIIMNFASGSYMAGAFSEDKRPAIISEVMTLIPVELHNQIQFAPNDTETLLTPDKLILQKDDIVFLQECGAVFKKYKTEALCKKAKIDRSKNATALGRHRAAIQMRERAITKFGADSPYIPPRPATPEPIKVIEEDVSPQRGGSKRRRSKHCKRKGKKSKRKRKKTCQ